VRNLLERSPQPNRGTDPWIPLRLDPEQEELWDDFLDKESSTEVDELRSQKHRKMWTLHISVEYEVENATGMIETPTRVTSILASRLCSWVVPSSTIRLPARCSSTENPSNSARRCTRLPTVYKIETLRVVRQRTLLVLPEPTHGYHREGFS